MAHQPEQNHLMRNFIYDRQIVAYVAILTVSGNDRSMVHSLSQVFIATTMLALSELAFYFSLSIMVSVCFRSVWDEYSYSIIAIMIISVAVLWISFLKLGVHFALSILISVIFFITIVYFRSIWENQDYSIAILITCVAATRIISSPRPLSSYLEYYWDPSSTGELNSTINHI